MIVEIPVRHGKSVYLSQYLPSWFEGTFPDLKTILTSYEANFARSWGRKARDTLQQAAGWFNIRLRQDAQAASDWLIAGHAGGMTTAGVGGPIGGKGADLLIVDDPIKNAEEAASLTTKDAHWDWWRSTALPRLEPRGCAIIGMARWATDDLVGRVLGGYGEAPEPVVRVRLPALAHTGDEMGRAEGESLWPQRWSVEKLLRQKTTVGPYYWAALYDQNPRKAGQREWPAEWFGPSVWFDEWPLADRGQKVISLDSSKGKGGRTGDYSAFIKAQWYQGVLYVDADMANDRNSSVIADTAVELQAAWNAHVFAVEEEFGGDVLGADIYRRAGERELLMPLVGVTTEGVNKEVRIRRLTPYLSRGTIRFKSDSPGAKLVVQQLEEFPQGEHDDGPDALEMAIRVLIEGGSI
jgi:predicted phage terminase large subunit-like protein